MNPPEKVARMKTALITTALLFLAAPVVADPPTVAEITERMVGRWETDECVKFGEEVDEDQLEGVTVITADTITTYDASEKEIYKATYTINPTTEPMQIDMVATMGGREMPALGIIKFEWPHLGEDEFELAYSLAPGERPTEFESPEGSKIIVLEMEEEDD